MVSEEHSTESATSPWEYLRELLESRDAEAIRAELERIGSRETGRALARLDEDQQHAILALLDTDTASHLIEEMSDVQAAALVEHLEVGEAADIIEAMHSNEAADLLSDIGEEQAQAIIEEMEPAAAEDAILLTKYDDDVAGGLMVREFLAYPETQTTADVINDLRVNAEKYRHYDVQYAYVVSPKGRLRGVLPLRDLLLQAETTPISETMRAKPVTVIDSEKLDSLQTFFTEHNFLAAPVVNEKQQLLGVVTRDAVDEALSERADDIYLKTQGIVGGDELRSMPVLLRSRRRLSWLSVNIVLNVMAASVIAYFEDTLSAVIALAVFLPIISDMSGCSGNQAVAVTMREITLGLIKPVDAVWVWLQELKVGAINGLALGALVAVLAWIWKGNPYLGLVAGSALCLNTVVAVSIGGLVPLLLRRFDMDPALASGPILTTVTDLCGFMLVLGFATAMLDYLV